MEEFKFDDITEEGYKRYKDFVKRFNIKKGLMTPHSCVAKLIGDSEIDSDEYFYYCLSELLENFRGIEDD
jgi:hypothetical protein